MVILGGCVFLMSEVPLYLSALNFGTLPGCDACQLRKKWTYPLSSQI